MLKRLWSEYRNACLLTLTLLVIGIVASPWVLIIALMPIGWVLLMPKGPQLEQHPETIESSEEVESIEPLKGTTLLEKIKELGDVSKSDLVKACGYVSTKKDGGERLNFTAFYEALLEAKGVEITTSSSDSEEQREDSHQTNLSKSIEEALIRIISENIKEYGISDLQEIYDDSTQRSYDFSRLEGSYESTLYEWIHIYLKNTGLYNSFLNAKQLAQAEAVPEGTIYGPNDEEDENYEGIQEQIDELHWDCILVVAKEGIRQGLNIYGIPEYLENCGMDEYLEEINSIKVDKSNNGVADEVNSENSWEALDEDELIERLKGTEVPIDIIRKFVNSENWEIRRTIALREDLPLEIIEKLRNDDDDDVKDAVAYRQLPVEWRKLDDDEKIEKLKDDENVDSNIIKIFSSSSNWGIRQAVAQNPNTPENILKILTDDDDDDVKDAVAYRQLPVEWRKLDDDEKIEKLKDDENVDDNIIEILSTSNNCYIRVAIALCSSTSSEIIDRLAQDDDDDVKDAVAYRQLPVEWRKLDDDEKIEKLKDDENVDDNIIEILSTSNNCYIRVAIALCSSTSSEIIDRLAQDDDDDVKDAVAYRQLPVEWRKLDDDEKIEKLKDDENVDDNIIEILSTSNNCYIRVAIALCSSTSSEIIDRLAQDDDDDVKDAVAYRQLPVEWRKLDDDEKIEKLKDDENVDDNIIEILSTSNNCYIRVAIALCSSTSSEIIDRLAQDDDDDVKDAVAYRQLPVEWRKLDDDEKIEKLKDDENVDDNIIEILSTSNNWGIRQAVAQSPSTTENILKILIHDDDDDVKKATKKALKAKEISYEYSINKDDNDKSIDDDEVGCIKKSQLPAELRSMSLSNIAKRINERGASKELLEVLSSTDNHELKCAIAENTSTSEEVLIKLIKESEVNWRENSCSDSVDDLARENLYRRKIPIEFRAMEEQAIIEALKQEDAEEEMLKTCAEYGPVYIRSAVAGNPKTPQETLGMLANDVNSGWVKEVVALNPNCSKETINRLLHDDDTHGILVRRAALLNGLPNDWIKLIQDEDIGEIRKRMINEHPSLKVINTLLKRDEEEFTSSYDNKQFSACVVYYPDTPDDILNHLRQDDDEYIKAAFRETTMPSDWVVMSDEERISALKSSDVPLEVFNTLALSPNYQIRLAIARSDKTSQPILDILANDSDSEVKEAIRQRELPEEWRELEQEELIKRFEEGLANEIILEFFSKSSDWHVRQAVAQNTSTPEKILTTLREDEDDDVKEAANKSLRILNPNSDAFGKERKSIYMKTEPGGRIAFSQLDQNQVNLLIQSISKMNLDEALDELRYSGVDAEGVVNSGDEGEYGNEGRIFFNEYLQRIGPDEDKETEKFKDGIYAVLMSLSKCSIEFEFELDEEFDNDKLEETCVPIRLPSEIKHGLYGHPDFNIITGFKYDGEEIEEDYEIIDRGYDDQFTIFSIKEGKTTVIYSNYNGDEEWNNSAEILNLM